MRVGIRRLVIHNRHYLLVRERIQHIYAFTEIATCAHPPGVLSDCCQLCLPAFIFPVLLWRSGKHNQRQ